MINSIHSHRISSNHINCSRRNAPATIFRRILREKFPRLYVQSNAQTELLHAENAEHTLYGIILPFYSINENFGNSRMRFLIFFLQFFRIEKSYEMCALVHRIAKYHRN